MKGAWESGVERRGGVVEGDRIYCVIVGLDLAENRWRVWTGNWGGVDWGGSVKRGGVGMIHRGEKRRWARARTCSRCRGWCGWCRCCQGGGLDGRRPRRLVSVSCVHLGIIHILPN